MLGNYIKPSKNEEIPITGKDLKISEYEDYFVKNHLKLKKIHLRGKLLLGLKCLENVLKEDNSSHQFFEHFIEQVWTILEKPSELWKENHEMEEEFEAYRDSGMFFKIGYHVEKYAEGLEIPKWKYHNAMRIVSSLSDMVINCFFYKNFEEYFGNIPTFHPFVRILEIMVSNAIEMPNIDKYLKYEGQSTDLGEIISRRTIEGY